MGQISYFLFYPSSGTASSKPRPIPIRVQRDDLFQGPAPIPLRTAHAAQILCLLRPIPWKAQPVGWTACESFTLRLSPTYGSAHSTVHSAARAQVILRVGSHPTTRVTPYGSGRLMGWGILSSGSLHGYGQFLWSLLALPDLSM